MFGVGVHRAKLVDPERAAVEPHALLAVEHTPRRRPLDGERNDGARHQQNQGGGTADRQVDGPLDDGVDPLQRNVVNIDDGNAVEVLEPRAQREELDEVGHHLHVHHFPARVFDEVEHLDVLVERQRHVQVVDVFLPQNLRSVVEGPQQWQASITEMIAARPVVDETDHLITELAMLKDFFGNHASQIPCAGNQDPLQADAGFPSPLENFPDQLARAERQHDVDDEEQRPDDAGDLIRADRLFLGRGVIRVHIQRGHDAENDCDNGTDENQEEVVHPGPAAAQAIDAL